MRYMMIVMYDGRGFSGFQRQTNSPSVQEELEKAIKIATKSEVTCVASGRTDAFESALCQPVHFDIKDSVDEGRLMRSLNGILPDSIKVLSLFETDLHARFSAKKKTYTYRMYLSNLPLPLYADALRVDGDIDVKKMKKFLRLIRGEHDFAGFMASGSQVKSTIRTIYQATLKKDGLYLNFSITGNGFLYKMVRNIVGTMLSVGSGRLDLETLKGNLFSGYKATYTAPAEFLCLANVEYI